MSVTAPSQKHLNFEPFPKQRIFLLCPARNKFYGGQAGPGKSYAMLNGLIAVAMEYPGVRVILFRRKFTNLTDHIAKSKNLLRPLDVAEYNENDHLWTFKPRVNPYPDEHTGRPNPQPVESYLQFAHLVNKSNIEDHDSYEYGIMAFDESTHFTEDMIEGLQARNRTPVPGLINQEQMWFGSNPGNRGHAYFRDNYVNPPDENVELVAFWNERTTDIHGQQGLWSLFPPGTRGNPGEYIAANEHIVWRPDETEAHHEMNVRRIADGEAPVPMRTRAFIRARLQDNPVYYKSGEYQATLAAIRDPKKRRALLDGDWDVFEGQFFSEFNADIHVVAPFTPPAHWRKWRGLDWGIGKPLCCLWFTQDPDTEQIITYRELYGAGLNDSKVCELMTSMSQDEHIDMTLADPSMWSGDSRDDALSRAQIYEKKHVHLTPANNRRVDGWARVRDALALNGKTGEPGWVITRNCVNLIRTLPALVYNEDNAEDLDCFIAGTKVLTPEGERNIETLRLGDMVVTPIGNRRVIRDGISGTGVVMRVDFDNGQSLTGTPDHKVYVVGRGLTALCELNISDILGVRSTTICAKWSTTALRIRGALGATITSQAARIWRAATHLSTGRFTSTIMARSLMGTTSTTKTMTTTTTPLTIWKRVLHTSTPRTTWPSAELNQVSTNSTTNGIGAPKAGKFCKTTLARCGSERRKPNIRAAIVASLERRAGRVPASIAPTSANTNTNAPITIFGRVLFAAKSLAGRCRTSSPCKPVRISAVGSYVGVERVYNLTVEEAHLYYANGVLVTNTEGEDHAADAARYGLMARSAFTRRRTSPLKHGVRR